MLYSEYKGRQVIIKSDDSDGIIEDVKNARNADGKLIAVFIVRHISGKIVELRPDQVKF